MSHISSFTDGGDGTGDTAGGAGVGRTRSPSPTPVHHDKKGCLCDGCVHCQNADCCDKKRDGGYCALCDNWFTLNRQQLDLQISIDESKGSTGSGTYGTNPPFNDTTIKSYKKWKKFKNQKNHD